MPRLFSRVRVFATLAVLVGASYSLPASSHPLALDDLLKAEAFASARIDPSGRRLLLEIEVPYRDASSFEGFYLSRTSRSRLLTVDLAHPGPAHLAFPQGRGGYIAGRFSPSGGSVLVFRTADHRREAGVLNLAKGEVRWLGLNVDMGDFGATALWRSETELLLLALSPGDRPLQDRAQLAGMLDTPKLWTRSLDGTGASDVINGSGRFLADHPREPQRRLLVVDLRSGAQTLLASGPFESLLLSPKSDRLAVVSIGERVQPPADALIRPDFEPVRRALSLIDLASARQVTPAPGIDLAVGSLRWSKSGQLLFAGLDADHPEGAPRLYHLAAGASTASPLALTIQSSTSLALDLAGGGVHFDWMDETPLIYARPANGRPDWYRLTTNGSLNLTAALSTAPDRLEAIGSDAVLAADSHALWRIDGSGRAERQVEGQPLQVLRPVDSYLAVPAPIDAPSERRTAMILAAGRRVVEVSLADAGWTIPLAAPAEISDAFGRDPGVVAASRYGAVTVRRDAQGVTHIDLTRPSGVSTALQTLNSHFAAVDWSSPIAIDHLGPNGAAERDWLYLPPHALAGRRYPLVVVGYPGLTFTEPPSAGRPGADRIDDNPQLVAAQGFAALTPSLPRAGPDLMEGMTEEVLAAVTRAAGCAEVDARRPGFWGHSGGGLLGFQLAVDTHRFAAIVAADGPTDLISDRGQIRPSLRLGSEWNYGERYQVGWTELGQGGLRATPYSGLFHYLAESPVFAADRITTPLLIVQGDQDPVPYTQGEEMFSALYRLRKDALLLTFFGESHSVGSPPNMRRYLDATFTFFNRELSPRP